MTAEPIETGDADEAVATIHSLPEQAEPAEAVADVPLPVRLDRLGQITAFQSELKTYVDEERADVEKAMLAAHEASGSKSFVAKYGDKATATFSLRESSDAITVRDNDAFTDWVMDNYPSEVETVIQVIDSFKKKLLGRVEKVTAEDGTVSMHDPEAGGLEVPGLHFKPGGEMSGFGVRWSGEGKALALDKAINGSMSDLLGIASGDDQ